MHSRNMPVRNGHTLLNHKTPRQHIPGLVAAHCTHHRQDTPAKLLLSISVFMDNVICISAPQANANLVSVSIPTGIWGPWAAQTRL